MQIKFLASTLIVLIFFISSGTHARVLPVYEEMEIQQEFILENISMPDLPGAQVEVVLEREVPFFLWPTDFSSQLKDELCHFPKVYFALNPELPSGIMNQQFSECTGSLKRMKSMY
jgi:hypothetical protein